MACFLQLSGRLHTEGAVCFPSTGGRTLSSPLVGRGPNLLTCPDAPLQLFGHRNAWCGEIEDATQRCPPGESCPAHRECYVDCDASQLGQWIEVRCAYLWCMGVYMCA